MSVLEARGMGHTSVLSARSGDSGTVQTWKQQVLVDVCSATDTSDVADHNTYLYLQSAAAPSEFALYL